LCLYLKTVAGVVAASIAPLAGYLCYDLLATSAATASQAENASLPPYDYAPWRSAVVHHDGRKKPFESFAVEDIRQITGGAKFEGKDPVAVVLSWMLTHGGEAQGINWEKYPFILCDYHEL